MPLRRSVVHVAVVAAAAMVTSCAMAEIKLPSIFSDHMVLQAGREITIWGAAKPGEQVTVAIGNEKATSKADGSGKFSAKLPALKASATPAQLTISGDGNDSVKIDDVLVGEVWLGSGQSNMALAVKNAANAERVIGRADHPQIRLYTVPHKRAGEPLEDSPGKWVVCSPETVPGFSAVLYQFGQTLNSELNGPVGLIHASVGGTPLQAWMPRDAFSDAEFSAQQARTTNTPSATRGAGGAGAERGKLPAQHMPTVLYNGMIAPVAPYTIRGVVWYQGEANVHDDDGPNYGRLFGAMVASWRKHFENPDLPVYFVELPPYGGYRSTSPGALPVFWEVQSKIVRDVPHTGMAPTADVGDPKNIHPKEKEPVGRRLAAIALADTYGRSDVVHEGPTYANLKVEGDKIRVHFGGAAGGLKTRDGQPPSTFEIAGADGKYVPASARIEGGDVVVWADGVKAPTSVRVGWSATAEPNLQNKEGWPVLQFRTDSGTAESH